MTETNKGGRPSIGTQITVTLPNADLKTIDEMAAKANVRRPDVIREIVHDAVSAVRRAEAAGAPLTERLQPAASLIVEWIVRGGGLEGRRARFTEYTKVAGHPAKLPDLLVKMAGSLVISGASSFAAALDSRLIGDLSSNKSADMSSGWRLRTALFFEVGNLMTERGVTVGPVAGASDDASIDFGPAPADDGDYA